MKAELNKFPYVTVQSSTTAAPANPETGTSRLYVRSDGAMAIINSAGVVTLLTRDSDLTTLSSNDRDRANHTGFQPVSTLSDFVAAVKSLINSNIAAGANVTKTVDATTGVITISSTGGGTGGTIDDEAVQDIAATLIQAGTNIQVSYDDTLNKLTISTTATANSTDAQLRDRTTHTGTQSLDTTVDSVNRLAFTSTERSKLAGIQAGATANSTDTSLRDRSTHTGTQAISTVTGLQTALDAKAATTAISDMVTSASGVGRLVLIREGVDTSTGAANEVILSTSSGTVGGSTTLPPGLDTAGGIVGCTWADPAAIVVPGTNEADGNVVNAVANQRIAARFKIYDDTLNKVTWMIGASSTVNITGTIGIARSDGVILRQATVNLTPTTANGVTATYGDQMTWSLSSALTSADISVGDELIVFTQHTGGNVYYYGRGFANLANIDTVTRLTGTLHRSGGVASAAAVPATGSPLSPLPDSTGWTKKPVPLFIFSRTI